jgi:RNA polymerase sigma-70 factor (ECF subfamily)
MAAGQLAQHLWSALEQLSPRQRQVVMLRELGELDGDEVCELLAISPSHQRVLLHRGRSHLRQALEDEMGQA